MDILLLLCSTALSICVYGIWVERNLRTDDSYKAACDLNDWVSCSKAFKSPYATLIGISNVYVGIIFYTVIAICVLLGWNTVVLALSAIACIVSFFLAYILYVHIKTVCVLCTSIYVINVQLFIVSLYRMFFG